MRSVRPEIILYVGAVLLAALGSLLAAETKIRLSAYQKPASLPPVTFCGALMAGPITTIIPNDADCSFPNARNV